MDFLHSHKQNPANSGSNEPGNEMSHGSKNLKHQRSGISEDIWKLPKMPRVDEVDFNTMKKSGSEIFGRSDLWTSGVDDGQKMLSFSSNSEPNRCNRNIAFSIYQDENNRVNGGGFSEAMMRNPFARLKGPFTPSQWMELEIQALIYKHFVANVPVPSNLLTPIKKSLYSYGQHASYPSNFLGWGPFHLGYSGSNDPEPGRCRRTDGKKWRCSRDAVPDQKYCERHINRGRHRSRKPVEGQSGQAVPGSATTTNINNKVEPIAPSSSSASVISSRSASSCLGAMQLEQYNSLQQQHNTGSAFIDHLGSRTQGFQGIPLTPKIDMKSTEVPFSIQKEQHLPPFEDSSHSMFGLVTSDALVNPSERISYMTNTRDSDSFIGFNEKETSDRHPVHHFMDDWPKDHHSHQPDHPKELKSDWTQLSMSIPDFSSSSTSPVQEKASEIIPTLSLSHEWGNSMGGPLGEVLTSTTTSTPHGLSPTGVLQKSTLFTLSNSSSGSRDDVDNNTPENANLFNVLGSTRVSSTVDSSY